MSSKVDKVELSAAEPNTVTLLTAVDVLTGLGLCVVVPKKGRCAYAKAELLKFLRASGRTFGILQCDAEPSLKTLCGSVCDGLSGLTLRTTPVSWKQAHGSVGNLQAQLYGQIRCLKIQVERDFQVKVTVDMPLFAWIVKHAMSLFNNFAVHADGRTSVQRRWNKKCFAALCVFGEAVNFRLPLQRNKADPAWTLGMWLGKDFESNEQIVYDPATLSVRKCRSLRRLSPSQQFQKSLLNFKS